MLYTKKCLDDAETTYKHYTTLLYTGQLQYELILFIAFIVFWYSTLYKVGGMREHTLVHTFNTQYYQSVPRLRSWCMKLVGFRFTFGCWRARGTEYAKWDCERRGISRFWGFFGLFLCWFAASLFMDAVPVENQSFVGLGWGWYSWPSC
jgi:hypothetical protein